MNKFEKHIEAYLYNNEDTINTTKKKSFFLVFLVS